MAEPITTPNGNNSAQGAATPAAENTNGGQTTFTQADINRIITERLARAKADKVDETEPLGDINPMASNTAVMLQMLIISSLFFELSKLLSKEKEPKNVRPQTVDIAPLFL